MESCIGTSLGGIFAVYSLFHEPGLFNRYIIVSPSLWWDNEMVFKYEKNFAEKNGALNAKVFISSGEYEEAIDFGNGFNRFGSQLRASRYKGLELESVVLEKMSHSASAAAGAAGDCNSYLVNRISKSIEFCWTSILDVT